jgi:hypothetical protein
MSVEIEVRVLLAEIGKSLQVLERLEGRLADFAAREVDDKEPGTETAMVLAQYFSNYYTCIETVFLRISRFFENSLPAHRWHRELIEKMSVSVDGIRPRVIADETRLGKDLSPGDAK